MDSNVLKIADAVFNTLTDLTDDNTESQAVLGIVSTLLQAREMRAQQLQQQAMLVMGGKKGPLL